MILMINGAFGVGKTTTAESLVSKIPGSMLYDPEEVGYMLHAVTRGILPPEEMTGDFQDIAIWSPLVVEVAAKLRARYQRHLIVPMTLVNETYYATIKGGFERIDTETYAFCLTASLETIHQRLLSRGAEPGEWALAQTERCLKAFESNVFAPYIDTETRSAVEIVALIMSRIPNLLS
jgi:hypothetical protein